MSKDIDVNIIIEKNKEVPRMAVMAKPCKGNFIVSGKDMDKLQQKKMTKSNFEQIKDLAKKFNEYNLKKD